MPRARPLPDGLYEHLLTTALARDLSALPPSRLQDTRPLDPTDAPRILSRHLAAELERALECIPRGDRPQTQIQIVNRLLTELRALVPDSVDAPVPADVLSPGMTASAGSDPIPSDAAHVSPPGTELLALFSGSSPPRPITPLTSSTLLTRNPAEPNLSVVLEREIASTDRIDVLVAFVTVGGVRAVRRALDDFARRSVDRPRESPRLRVLTSIFTGTTELAAVQALAGLPGARVKVSYDDRRTRLHAKAWLFHRDSGLHTAYVGSANLTSTALGSGQEWMVKICAADLPHVIEKFQGTFEALWNDAEFEPFEPGVEASRKRLGEALGAQRAGGTVARIFFALRPLPFQEEILDRLEAERDVHGRRRNLIVAATGTGKTLVAAFDYLRQVQRAGVTPRLLFVAHRRELLDQARAAFRQVLQDGSFGELLTAGQEPTRWDHVFATIQSVASRNLVERFGPEHFRYVVVDECHHAPADSYRRLVPNLRPDILLGLTATPERSDGKSLLPDFDGHIAAELRIWHALERHLLAPFEYYGISDEIDLSRVRWSRTGYDLGELAGVYTGNQARVDLIVAQLRTRVADPGAIRAIAFCVSVEHAEFMAKALIARGLPALAVHGETPDDVREDARRRLRAREVNVLCTCDLYNEGVDLPFVDTLLFLRPTASATLFLQQLGRGLRLDPGKLSCLVLDFIGRHRTDFRFDGVLAALTGVPRASLAKAVQNDFPFLPSGCVLQLDAVARTQVLDSLRLHLGRRSRLVEEVRELARDAEPLSLARFLEATGRELEDVYSAGGWTTVRREAGLVPGVDEDADDLSRRLGWLLHVDEPARLRTWTRALEGDPELTELERRRLLMLDFGLHHRGVLRTAEETAQYIGKRPEIRSELTELAGLLGERIALPRDLYPLPQWPLALHRHYKQHEILAAVGEVQPGAKGKTLQGGILKLKGQKRELLFITLDKSDRSFSPTTRYRDYAISPSLFHWETQSVASVTSDAGRRYLDSPGNGWTFHLFVRTEPGAAYAYAGPARYRSHEGDRPIAITWQLEHGLPAQLYRKWATLAQG